MNQKNMWPKNFCFSVGAVLFCAWVIWSNTALEVNTYRISSDRIPEAFSGFRIAQISDLHNTEFGEGNEVLLSLLEGTKPDIIVITGDLIDSRKTNLKIALEFVGNAAKIAPVYFVSGNHEARIEGYKDLKSGMENAGVMILDNKSLQLERGGAYITLMGIKDPSFNISSFPGNAAAATAAAIESIQTESDRYTILLSHRPELFDVYVGSGVDLVLTGHAHGGQFRIPFVGGVLVPNQGFFPEYDAGLFTEENTNMIISRGIGNSRFPIRFNNRPEIVLVELGAL